MLTRGAQAVCPIEDPRSAIDTFLNRLSPGRLLVAVSGGSDSLGLLTLLHEALAAAPRPGVTLCAATIDHGLRAGAAEEAEQVGSFCRQRDIPHRIARWQGEKPTTGLAASAREARYRLLADLAEDFGTRRIVTAHTLDDQRETIAMRASRTETGDQAPGLSGMAALTLYDCRIFILRPWLACRRQDIRDELTRRDIPWVDDPSNQDLRSERVRTRRTLGVDHGYEAALKTIKAAAEGRRQLSDAAAALLDSRARMIDRTVAVLAPDIADAAPAPLAHAISALIMVLGGRRHLPGREQMDKVMALVTGPYKDRHPDRTTAGRCLIVRSAGGLFIARECRGLPSLRLEPGDTAIWDGRFRITSHSDEPVLVHAGRNADDAAEYRKAETEDLLPPFMRRHADAVAPRFSLLAQPQASRQPDLLSLACKPELGGYDRFLSGFDLELANALAALFGRDGFSRPPV